MATHSNIRAWEIPWTEEPGGLQSMVSQRVIHGLVAEQYIYIYIYLPLLLSLPSLSCSSYSDPSNFHSRTLNPQPPLVHLLMSFFFKSFQPLIWECASTMSFQSCLTLCNPVDYSPPDSSVHGILQARILECIAIPSSSIPYLGINPSLRRNLDF